MKSSRFLILTSSVGLFTSTGKDYIHQNTDYVLTKEENFRKAPDVLKGAGHEIEFCMDEAVRYRK